MAIYTRTGDKGKTSLFNGQRVAKDSLRIETIGTIDELNAVIGVVLLDNLKLKSELIKIQNDLFNIGANLANPEVSNQKSAVSSLEKRVKEFENFIDKMTEQMPPLTLFILPGVGRSGAFLHLARTVCRRAERRAVALANKDPSASSGQVDKNILIYLNRLSDLLFTMARYANFKEKKKETIWSKEK